jgi:hypothetical protein
LIIAAHVCSSQQRLLYKETKRVPIHPISGLEGIGGVRAAGSVPASA